MTLDCAKLLTAVQLQAGLCRTAQITSASEMLQAVAMYVLVSILLLHGVLRGNIPGHR